jgi:hypothetical protein
MIKLNTDSGNSENFIESTMIRESDVRWQVCPSAPMQIHGLAVSEPERFWRLPAELIDHINDKVSLYARNTAGARIRFRTNSPYIALRIRLLYPGLMVDMPLTGMSGCDIYIGSGMNAVHRLTVFPCDSTRIVADYSVLDAYRKTVWRNPSYPPAYEGILYRSRDMADITINLPLYNGVVAVHVGLAAGSDLEAPAPYAISEPIVFYGSSITQGACASRPGCTYQAILSRMLDADYLNLGFSSGAHAEDQIARYIASLSMRAFVLDYDYNASSPEYLAETHEKFFRTIREACPDLPILMLSKPDFDWDKPMNSIRRKIIFQTWQNACHSGDKQVWFIDGEKLFGTVNRDSCTVDGRHPNDLGFMRMAENIYPVLKSALEGKDQNGSNVLPGDIFCRRAL